MIHIICTKWNEITIPIFNKKLVPGVEPGYPANWSFFSFHRFSFPEGFLFLKRKGSCRQVHLRFAYSANRKSQRPPVFADGRSVTPAKLFIYLFIPFMYLSKKLEQKKLYTQAFYLSICHLYVFIVKQVNNFNIIACFTYSEQQK